MTHVMSEGPAARKERQHATEAPKRVIAVWHGSKAGSHPLKGLYGASGGPWVRNSHTRPLLHFPANSTLQQVQVWASWCTVSLRLLGYMDTLVHFGRFRLATLVNSKIDSYPTGN